MKVTDEDHKAAQQVINKIIQEIDLLEGEGSFRVHDASRYYHVFMEGVKHARKREESK